MALTGLLGDNETPIVVDAVLALGNVHAEGAATGLVPLLKSPEARVRFAAAVSLWDLCQPDTLDALIEALTDPSIAERAVGGVNCILEKTPRESAVEPLLRFMLCG